MLNERDGGINGVKWPGKGETQYDTKQGVSVTSA